VRKGADLYEVLGVAPSATADDLKAAYRELARQHNPDRARTYIQKIAATRRMQAINAAYAVLRDPRRRAAYDAERAALFEEGWRWLRRTADVPPAGEGSPPTDGEGGSGAEMKTAPLPLARDAPPAIALGMALVGAATVLFVGGRVNWSVAALFLLGQLAYCYRTDCLDDWAWGLGLGLLALWWFLTRQANSLLFALAFPHGVNWQGALGAASGVSAIFIGVRQLKRRGRPLLDDTEGSVFKRL